MEFLVPGRQSVFCGRAIFIEGRQDINAPLHATQLGCMLRVHITTMHICDYDVMRVGTLPILARNTLDRSSWATGPLLNKAGSLQTEAQDDKGDGLTARTSATDESD